MLRYEIIFHFIHPALQKCAIFQIKWHHLGGKFWLMWRSWRWAGSEWLHFLAYTPQEHMALKEQSLWAVLTTLVNVTNPKVMVRCTRREAGSRLGREVNQRILGGSQEEGHHPATCQRVSLGVRNVPHCTLIQDLPIGVLFTEN